MINRYFKGTFVVLIGFLGVKIILHPSLKTGGQGNRQEPSVALSKNSHPDHPAVTQKNINKYLTAHAQERPSAPVENLTKDNLERMDFKTKYPQVREVIFRVATTKELWEARLQKMPPQLRARVEGFPMPETLLLTADDQPIVPFPNLKSVSGCPALENAAGAITVNINEKGQIQDAINTDPENQAPIPEEIYGCTFQPYTVNGTVTSISTTLVPQSEIKATLQYVSGN